MSHEEKLSDYTHPAVKEKTNELIANTESRLEQLEKLFYFVRDSVLFGFPNRWDEVKASETLECRRGYCITKATLFHSLCRAVGIPSRIHVGLISSEVMRGVFPSFSFSFLPRSGVHSWMEVEVDGEWKHIDSYINDRIFYDAALALLQASEKTTAYSISTAKGPSSCEFNFGETGFVHMGAVVDDHGTWDDFSDYMASDKYPDMGRIQLASYPVFAFLSNRNISRIRR